ncbi:hypothetical protein KGM_204766 [Danaus plexippus plexippus]|uniref:Uncharacterized protein n=1 Tax=Danaus plexippus plexippus TaxID=278856 RepID=A0A212FED0_DANPL|nr:hypothetical protein KGM_204766 [Danaus plexippus plexippus]
MRIETARAPHSVTCSECGSGLRARTTFPRVIRISRYAILKGRVEAPKEARARMSGPEIRSLVIETPPEGEI